MCSLLISLLSTTAIEEVCKSLTDEITANKLLTEITELKANLKQALESYTSMNIRANSFDTTLGKMSDTLKTYSDRITPIETRYRELQALGIGQMATRVHVDNKACLSSKALPLYLVVSDKFLKLFRLLYNQSMVVRQSWQFCQGAHELLQHQVVRANRHVTDRLVTQLGAVRSKRQSYQGYVEIIGNTNQRQLPHHQRHLHPQGIKIHLHIAPHSSLSFLINSSSISSFFF